MSAAAEALSTSVVQSVYELRELRDVFARVAEAPKASTAIVQHPDWLLFELAWRGEIFSPYIVVVRNAAGEVVGYAPLLSYVHHARVALGNRHLPIYRGRALRLLGAGVVAEPALRRAVETAVSEALRRARLLHVLRIQETDLPNALASELARGSRRFTSVQANLLDQVRWSIDPQPLADWMSHLGSKKRNDLTRRQRNVYKKLGDQARLEVFESEADMPRYAALMNQVYAKSWHAREMPTDWELPARKALFADLARGGHLVGYLLMVGEQPVAYVHGYRYGGSYLVDDTGYDEAFGALGVGSTLVFQAVCDRLERHPGEAVDFGYGDNQYKRVLATRQTPCGSLYLVRGVTPLARFSVMVPLRRLYRWMHEWKRREQASVVA